MIKGGAIKFLSKLQTFFFLSVKVLGAKYIWDFLVAKISEK